MAADVVTLTARFVATSAFNLGEQVQITLTKGMTAEIDDLDADLANCGWSAAFTNGNFRGATRRAGHTMVLLHRVIAERMFGKIDGKIVDHIDRDPSNNRRSNLRIVTAKQSQHNRGRQKSNKSGFIGVSWNEQKQKWHAQARGIGGKRKHLGLFGHKHVAALVYDQFILRDRGLFAVTNFQHVGALTEAATSSLGDQHEPLPNLS
jgi:hypothetical protein